MVRLEAQQILYKVLIEQLGAGRSLGTGDDSIAWPEQLREVCSGVDLLASACDVIGSLIGHTISKTDRVVLAGGGAFNRTLVDVIRANCKAAASLSDDFGVPVQYREAVCMAVLTALARDGVSVTLPQVTGRDPNARCFPCWIEP